MARITLNATKGGIDRQRTDGSPSPQVLYDLLNGYINSAAKMVSRPGTRKTHNLPAGVTKGFCVYQGAFVVFSHQPQTVPTGVTCEVLVHPEDATLPLLAVHFAWPMLQYLYVVAEFTNGDVFHYWLQRAATWQANTIYLMGALVQPTVPNGYVYQATRLGDPNPLWTANAVRAVGERVEPTTADGYYYEVTATVGTNPRSGTTEPVWNDESGAVTYEDVNTAVTTPPGTGPITSPTTPGTDITDRYDNPNSPIDARREQ